MKIINIVSSVSKINYGVWNAAFFGSDYLKSAHQIDAELWICTKTTTDYEDIAVPYQYFQKDQKSKNGFEKWLKEYDKNDTLVVTHGAWLEPTKMGYWAKQKGFKWIHLPQGMMEPHAFKTSTWKKKIYLTLFEGRYLKKVDVIRAVSDPEYANLCKMFPRVVRIFNGVKALGETIQKDSKQTIYLFLARLHKKKGIVHLVEAWANEMYSRPNSKLIIAGPDEGELKKIQSFIHHNIDYIGPVFGEEKINLLKKTHYYVLPSYSEGFPSSVVEAMSYGAIPVISEGCNFPQVFVEKLGFEVSTNHRSIQTVFSELKNCEFDIQLSQRNIDFVKNNLSEEVIGEQLYQLYRNILN
ncbi:MAG: glycosyltransferase [Bacteroidales bacterium]